MQQKKIDEHTPDYPRQTPEQPMTEEEALAFLRSPAKEFHPDELHAVGIVTADTAEPLRTDVPVQNSFLSLRELAKQQKSE